MGFFLQPFLKWVWNWLPELKMALHFLNVFFLINSTEHQIVYSFPHDTRLHYPCFRFNNGRLVSHFRFAKDNRFFIQFHKCWFRRCSCRWFHRNTRFQRNTPPTFVVCILVILAGCFVNNRIRIFVRLIFFFGNTSYGCH